MSDSLDERRERAARALRDCARLSRRNRPLGAPKFWANMGTGDLDRVAWPAWPDSSARPAGALAREWLGDRPGDRPENEPLHVSGLTDGAGGVVAMLGWKYWRLRANAAEARWLLVAPDFRGLGFGSALAWQWLAHALAERPLAELMLPPVRPGDGASARESAEFLAATLGGALGGAGGTVFERSTTPAERAALLTDTVLSLGAACPSAAQPAILADALQDAGAEALPRMVPYLRALRGGACAVAFGDFCASLLREGRAVQLETYPLKRS